MAGEVRLRFSENGRGGYVVVPPVAVAGDPSGGNHVWVVDEQAGVVRRRAVTPGELVSDGIEILSGLEPGELLVVRGVHSLEDGQAVRVLAADAQGGGAGS